MGGNKISRILKIIILEGLLFLKTAVGFTPQYGSLQVYGPSTGSVAIGEKAAPLRATSGGKADEIESDDEEWIAAEISEVIVNNEMDEAEEEAWIPDREIAKRKRERVQANQFQPASSMPNGGQEASKPEDGNALKVSPYTEEEEEVINAMGGQTLNSARKRDPGYLGDSTLKEISMDYSVPVCYLADVLCMWGVPVPININDRLGDLVTGEQAFAILEAVNSLDVAALNDRYSNQSLLNVCDDWNIDVSEGFEMAMKEGWSLPFGVHTVLRMEQEEELLRVLGGYSASV